VPEPTRFRDDESLPQYDGSPTLVACPRCQGPAEVVVQDSITALPRVVCSRCSYAEAKKWSGRVADSAPVDHSTGLPLWLQSPCAGHVLWAWNAWHLDFIERYVSADLRERTPNINMSLASRLPRWIKSAKNRDAVLKGIARLRGKLAETGAT
jgi:hypothetical protein